jgi:hypothetical protein
LALGDLIERSRGRKREGESLPNSITSRGTRWWAGTRILGTAEALKAGAEDCLRSRANSGDAARRARSAVGIAPHARPR